MIYAKFKAKEVWNKMMIEVNLFILFESLCYYFWIILHFQYAPTMEINDNFDTLISSPWLKQQTQ